MPKLNTDQIKTWITTPGNLDWFLAMYADDPDEQATTRAYVQDKKNWKRGFKGKLGNLPAQIGLEPGASIEEITESLEDEAPVILDAQELTPDCVARYFVCPEETLDCTIITDPEDQRILQVFWHHD